MLIFKLFQSSGYKKYCSIMTYLINDIFLAKIFSTKVLKYEALNFVLMLVWPWVIARSCYVTRHFYSIYSLQNFSFFMCVYARDVCVNSILDPSVYSKFGHFSLLFTFYCSFMQTNTKRECLECLNIMEIISCEVPWLFFTRLHAHVNINPRWLWHDFDAYIQHQNISPLNLTLHTL